VNLVTGQALHSTGGLRCRGLTPIDTGFNYNPVDAFNGRAGTASGKQIMVLLLPFRVLRCRCRLGSPATRLGLGVKLGPLRGGAGLGHMF